MKQLEKSGKVLELLKSSVGPEVNLDDLAVFEATAINTLPLRKRHPILKGAVIQEGVLHEMSERVKGESIPLQAMHEDQLLPFGRVFAGEVHNQGRNAELRVLFFLPKDTAGQQIDLIESGTVDQVSVSILTKRVLCSDCGWDFQGPDATIDNLWGGVCANDHEIGKKGTHAVLSGLDGWFELSLVGRGGAQKARIHGKSTSVMSDAQRQRFADAGLDPEMMLIRLSSEENGTMPGENTVNLTELVNDLVAKSTALTLAEKEIVDLKAANEALQAQVTELSGKSDETLEQVQAQLTEANTELDAAKAYLGNMATATLTAAKMAVPEDLSTVAKLTESIDAGKAFLHSVIPVGGVSAAAGADSTSKKTSNTAGLFRTVKR